MDTYAYNTLLEKGNELNVEIYDPFSFQTSDFQWKEGFTTHIVNQWDIFKPYRISRLYYRTIEYTDIILTLNNIQDPFELRPGFELYVPNLRELRQYLLLKKKPL
jgi:hypothetical protein